MKVTDLFPYLLLVAAGALSIPTLISAFTGAPASTVFVTLSSSCLLLALISLAYSRNSNGGSDLAKP